MPGESEGPRLTPKAFNTEAKSYITRLDSNYLFANTGKALDILEPQVTQFAPGLLGT